MDEPYSNRDTSGRVLINNINDFELTPIIEQSLTKREPEVES